MRAQAILPLANRPAGEALSALWYLGRNEVTPETIAQIRRKLPASEFQALIEARASMPWWMADAFHRNEQLTAQSEAFLRLALNEQADILNTLAPELGRNAVVLENVIPLPLALGSLPRSPRSYGWRFAFACYSRQ